MIEIQIINILSLFWKHNTFLAVYCTLVTVIYKTKKTAKQISKQDKTKKTKKKGRREKEGPQQGLNPVPSV